MIRQRECPLCNETSPWPRLAIATCVPDPLLYVQCQRCGLVFAEDPQPVPSAKPPLGPEELAHYRAWKLPINRERVSWLMRRGSVPKGRSADVGTKDGSAVKAASEQGWHTIGFDKDQRFHEFARQTYGVEIRPEWFTVDAVGPGTLSLVTAYHVFEHIPEPVSWLLEVRRALQPEGYLHIETPNLDGIAARLVNRGHVVLYTAHTLRQMLEKVGFRIVATTRFGPGGNRTYDQLGVLAQVDEPTPPRFGFSREDRNAQRSLARPWLEYPPSSVLLTRVYRAVKRRSGVALRRACYHSCP